MSSAALEVKLLHGLDVTAGAFSLEFSPDDQTLAVSGWGRVASLWDVAMGTQTGPSFTAGSRPMDLDLVPRRAAPSHDLGQRRGAVWDIDRSPGSSALARSPTAR